MTGRAFVPGSYSAVRIEHGALMSAPCDELEPTGPESPVSTTSWWMVELATAYSEKESENKAALALLTIGHDRRCPKPGQIQTTSTSCIFYRVTGASDDGPPVRCRDEISLRLRGVVSLDGNFVSVC